MLDFPYNKKMDKLRSNIFANIIHGQVEDDADCNFSNLEMNSNDYIADLGSLLSLQPWIFKREVCQNDENNLSINGSFSNICIQNSPIKHIYKPQPYNLQFEFDECYASSAHPSSIIPLVITEDGSRIINKSNDQFEEDGVVSTQMEDAGILPSLPEPRKSFKNSCRDPTSPASQVSCSHDLSSRMLLFCLGISIGIISTIISNGREIRRLNDTLKLSENLVQDLQIELDMKDSMAVKELENETIEINRDDKKYADKKEITSVHEKNSEMRRNEVEMEAKTERLELNMNAASLKGRISTLYEVDRALKIQTEAQIKELETALQDSQRQIEIIKTEQLAYHSQIQRLRDVSKKITSSQTLSTMNHNIPIVRSGSCVDIGIKRNMEDAHICCDNFMLEYGPKSIEEGPNAFYGVFDGHDGKHAAEFACSNLPRFIIEGDKFPREIEKLISSAFLQTDVAFAEACSLDSTLESGTTALVALVIGRLLVVANAGDCRAVLSRRGKAIELSQDHKPSSLGEKLRIESSGGYIYDGYLNGELSVARALGDWHMEGLKTPNDSGLTPLSAIPDIKLTRLTEEDEFLIIGCDGLWDVFRSQNAIDFARRKLQEHNDPQTCSKELVNEALKRNSGDNISVIVVCFQVAPPPDLVARRERVQRSISAAGFKELQSFLDE